MIYARRPAKVAEPFSITRLDCSRTNVPRMHLPRYQESCFPTIKMIRLMPSPDLNQSTNKNVQVLPLNIFAKAKSLQHLSKEKLPLRGRGFSVVFYGLTDEHLFLHFVSFATFQNFKSRVLTTPYDYDDLLASTNERKKRKQGKHTKII